MIIKLDKINTKLVNAKKDLIQKTNLTYIFILKVKIFILH